MNINNVVKTLLLGLGLMASASVMAMEWNNPVEKQNPERRIAPTRKVSQLYEKTVHFLNSYNEKYETNNILFKKNHNGDIEFSYIFPTKINDETVAKLVYAFEEWQLSQKNPEQDFNTPEIQFNKERNSRSGIVFAQNKKQHMPTENKINELPILPVQDNRLTQIIVDTTDIRRTVNTLIIAITNLLKEKDSNKVLPGFTNEKCNFSLMTAQDKEGNQFVRFRIPTLQNIDDFDENMQTIVSLLNGLNEKNIDLTQFGFKDVKTVQRETILTGNVYIPNAEIYLSPLVQHRNRSNSLRNSPSASESRNRSASLTAATKSAVNSLKKTLSKLNLKDKDQN